MAEKTQEAPEVDERGQPLARETLQGILFPDGRASISTFQRVHRLSWHAAHVTLDHLYEGGWLDGLDISPMLSPAPPAKAQP